MKRSQRTRLPRHAHARRSARYPGGDGQARHAAHHHRQGSGLHRHAGVPQQPEPGVSRTSASAAPAASASPASARRTCSTCRSTATTTRASPSTNSATRSTPRWRSIDPAWRERLSKTYRNAMSKGLWKIRLRRRPIRANTGPRFASPISIAIASTTGTTIPFGTREQLKLYDPEGYELVRSTFKLTPENDWRYQPMRQQPSVIAAAGQVQDRSLLHEVHLCPRVHGARLRTTSATRRCSRPTTPFARCSPIGTTS